MISRELVLSENIHLQKIFIPTVKRINKQITYNQLPDELKEKVCFVVQEWERDQYKFDAEYLVLPEKINLDNPKAIAETRKVIYQTGKNMKYSVLDDDIIFARRNRKYWTGVSNMKMSKRKCSREDILEMFDQFNTWLDEPDVSICGCAISKNPPSKTPFLKNGSVASVFWINGQDFAHELESMNLTATGIAEDVIFILSCLTRGYGTKISQEFIILNESVDSKDIKSEIWESKNYSEVQLDHQRIEAMFPDFFKIIYDDDGNRVPGGFRGFGKKRVEWSKAFKRSA